jgi:hypothetical protein
VQRQHAARQRAPSTPAVHQHQPQQQPVVVRVQGVCLLGWVLASVCACVCVWGGGGAASRGTTGAPQPALPHAHHSSLSCVMGPGSSCTLSSCASSDGCGAPGATASPRSTAPGTTWNTW